MRRFRKVSIYKNPGKTNVSEVFNKSGVYLIYKKGVKNPVYIGYSGSNLYKTLTRHFQSWNDRTQVRITYPQNGNYSVSIVLCTPEQAVRLEKYLIKKIRPVDNPNKYDTVEITKWDINVYDDFGSTDVEPAPF